MARTDNSDGHVSTDPLSGSHPHRLTLAAWLLVPFAFVLLVLALSLCVDAALGAFTWQLTAPSALYGAAAAVCFGAVELVRWHTERQRRLLRWGYPAAFLAFGIVVTGLTLPSIVILAATVPAAALLVAGWRPGLKIEADPSLPGTQHGGNSGTISGMIGGPDITGSSL